MLLVIDVGNTNTVLGLLDGDQIAHTFRISTKPRTTDETGMTLRALFDARGLDGVPVHGVIISSVVPSVLFSWEKASRRYLGVDPMIVGRALKTGMPVRTDNPREVGADRIVNAVAAVEQFGAPVVVVDFGTATTVDCVDANGAYIGGAIAPGLTIAEEALFSRTAKLPRVELTAPESVIGRNTVTAIQSGLFLGYVGLVEHLARLSKDEVAALAGVDHVPCVATGGLSNLIGSACDSIDHVDGLLTLRGLKLLYDRNTAA